MKQLEQKHKDLINDFQGEKRDNILASLSEQNYDLSAYHNTVIQTTLSDNVRVVEVGFKGEYEGTADGLLKALFEMQDNFKYLFENASNQIKEQFPKSILSTHLVPQDNKHYMICQMTTVSYKYEMKRLKKEKSNVFELLTERKGFRNTAVQKDKQRGVTVVTFEILK